MAVVHLLHERAFGRILGCRGRGVKRGEREGHHAGERGGLTPCGFVDRLNRLPTSSTRPATAATEADI